MANNQLPAVFTDLNEMSTASRGVAILYGRRADGTMTALKTADDGTLASGVSVVATATLSGFSTNYFHDQVGTVLTGVFALQTFGFTSFNISLFNDDQTGIIEFSFDGVNVHGRLLVGESVSMDYRAHTGIYLRTVSGVAASYRVSAY